MTTKAKTRRDVLKGVAAAGAAISIPAPVLSQERFPNRTIRVVVPFPAGATTDMLARLIAQRMTESMGQTVVIENVGGGGGSIGADQVAKAAPDGHTLLFHNITFTTTTSALQFAKRARHDIEQDFVPISVGAYVPLMLLATPSLPVNDLKEFVEYARKSPEPLNYGSTGPGSIMNLQGEVLKRDTGIKMDHIPFRGAAPLVQEMLAGRIHFGGDQLSSSLSHVRSGALKAVAMANPTRSPALPNVPTVRELGFPNLEVQGWNGFLAPKGTPDAICARLQQEVAAAVKNADINRKMVEVGAEPSGSTRDEMRTMLREQIAKIKPLVEELKLVIE